MVKYQPGRAPLGIALFALITLQVSVAKADERAAIPPKLDFSEQSFAHCKATPPADVHLTARESCLIDSLRARCNAADDCLVSCIASGKARDVGGGCWHLCFEIRNDLSKWREPKGMSRRTSRAKSK